VQGKGVNADGCIHVGSLRGNSRQIPIRIENRKGSMTIVSRSYKQDKLRINFRFIEE
jgi:hypothetical protein